MKIHTIHPPLKETLAKFETDSVDVIVISTGFHPKEKYDFSLVNLETHFQRLNVTKSLIHTAYSLLKKGGLLFIYGLPKWLPHFGTYTNSLMDTKNRMVFKYWIAVDLDHQLRRQTPPPAHMGILMFLKSKQGKTNSP